MNLFLLCKETTVRAIFILLFIINCFSINAQDTLKFRIQAIDKDSSFINNISNYKRSVSSDDEMILEISRVINQLQSNGYIKARIINIYYQYPIHIAILEVNEEIKWGNLKLNDGENEIISKSSNRFESLENRPANFNSLKKNIETLLRYYENNGYPFAQIQIDSISNYENKLSANIQINKNKLIIIDSVNIISPNNNSKKSIISRAYLYNYLGIKPGDLYNEELIRNIKSRIKELQFIEELRPSSITFFADKAILNLFIKARQSNRFDFIIGVLPNNSTVNTASKILVTGDGLLNLNNAFYRGEQLNFKFEKLQVRTTKAKARIVYPYILSLPFGIDAGINIFLNDTLFRNIDYDFGVQYLISGTNYIKAYYKKFESRTLSIDTSVIIFSKQLPTALDVDNFQYGLEFNFEKTDFRLNPRKGIEFIINTAIGTRKIIRNPGISDLVDPLFPEYKFSSLYDSLQEKSYQYRIESKTAYYVPIGRTSTIKLQYKNAFIIGSSILQNELYRIGGSKTLRGFDEESILAKEQHTLTAEYRFLLGTLSYFNVFSDASYVKRLSNSEFIEDYPIGAGAGITFQTKAGIFAVSYALGRNNTSNFEFRNAKIHFGYINVF